MLRQKVQIKLLANNLLGNTFTTKVKKDIELIYKHDLTKVEVHVNPSVDSNGLTFSIYGKCKEFNHPEFPSITRTEYVIGFLSYDLDDDSFEFKPAISVLNKLNKNISTNKYMNTKFKNLLLKQLELI